MIHDLVSVSETTPVFFFVTRLLTKSASFCLQRVIVRLSYLLPQGTTVGTRTTTLRLGKAYLSISALRNENKCRYVLKNGGLFLLLPFFRDIHSTTVFELAL